MENVCKNAPLKRQYGQGMTEYIIIVALIAVAAIAAFQFFGQTIRNQAAGIANEVAGKSASTSITNAQTSAKNVDAEGAKKKGLDSYGGADTNASK
jgi:Flp pilus assembly pilin Flp